MALASERRNPITLFRTESLAPLGRLQPERYLSFDLMRYDIFCTFHGLGPVAWE